MILGARHELEKVDPLCEVVSSSELAALGTEGALARIQAFAQGAPLYLSLDVDVLDPEIFAAVSDPVRAGISIELLTGIVHGALSMKPVAADIVEYNLLRDPDGSALRTLSPVLEEYARWFA